MAASLEAPGGWAAVTDSPVLVGDQWVVTLSLTHRAAFYRLQGQPANVR